MNVKLLTCTENPDKVCAMTAYVSTSKRPLSEFSKMWTEKDTEKWIKIVLERGHTSVLEHASFTFSLEGISRVCTHQLVRHRLASYCQQSLRRITPSKKSFKLPETVKKSKEWKKVSNILEDLYDAYSSLTKEDVPAGDARFILPMGITTNLLVTMNCRELHDVFFPLRCCTKAQWEIREVAWKMLEICKKKAPLIFKDVGPRCKKLGYCPEGEPCEEFKKYVKR
ncbi:MAG: FAD-dependent thymidylate synthase [Euryarchaeota archaeon]|nr:FAD-dependent thymidylate synthase [Euryarchaeota archaeon]